jgi:hypothetical protein
MLQRGSDVAPDRRVAPSNIGAFLPMLAGEARLAP